MDHAGFSSVGAVNAASAQKPSSNQGVKPGSRDFGERWLRPEMARQSKQSTPSSANGESETATAGPQGGNALPPAQRVTGPPAAAPVTTQPAPPESRAPAAVGNRGGVPSSGAASTGAPYPAGPGPGLDGLRRSDELVGAGGDEPAGPSALEELPANLPGDDTELGINGADAALAWAGPVPPPATPLGLNPGGDVVAGQRIERAATDALSDISAASQANRAQVTGPGGLGSRNLAPGDLAAPADMAARSQQNEMTDGTLEAAATADTELAELAARLSGRGRAGAGTSFDLSDRDGGRGSSGLLEQSRSIGERVALERGVVVDSGLRTLDAARAFPAQSAAGIEVVDFARLVVEAGGGAFGSDGASPETGGLVAIPGGQVGLRDVALAGAAQQTGVLATPLRLQGDFQDGLMQRVQFMLGSEIQAARVIIDPPELGPLDVRIAIQAGEAQVQLTAQQAATRDMLEQALPRLRELFEEAGLAFGGADIRHGGEHPSGQAGHESDRAELWPGRRRAGAADLIEPLPTPARRIMEGYGMLDVYA